MTKKLLITLLFSTALLTGCQSEATDAETNTDVNNDASEAVENTETEETTDETNEEEVVEEPEEVTYKYKINPDTFAVEALDETSEEKLVLLTYDDAPYGNSLEIAKALQERNVSAIFFVNGMYMEDEEGFETMKKVHEMGFEIANHTHTHAKLDDYTEAEQLDEIEKTDAIIEEAIGETPRFFRAPHGVMTDYVKNLMVEQNKRWMNWSFGYDWMGDYHEANALTDITLNAPELGNGSNILMHDRTWTAEATPAIVDGLIEQGYTIVDPKLITHE